MWGVFSAAACGAAGLLAGSAEASLVVARSAVDRGGTVSRHASAPTGGPQWSTYMPEAGSVCRLDETIAGLPSVSTFQTSSEHVSDGSGVAITTEVSSDRVAGRTVSSTSDFRYVLTNGSFQIPGPGQNSASPGQPVERETASGSLPPLAQFPIGSSAMEYFSVTGRDGSGVLGFSFTHVNSLERPLVNGARVTMLGLELRYLSYGATRASLKPLPSNVHLPPIFMYLAPKLGVAYLTSTDVTGSSSTCTY